MTHPYTRIPFMRYALLALALSLVAGTAARAQSLSQVYLFLAPLEGDTERVIHRANGEVVVGLGHDLPRDTGPHVSFSLNQRRCMMIGDFNRAMRAVHRYLPDYDSLPLDARLIVCSVFWTCGETGLMRFKRMRTAIEARMWGMAAYELADSKRARQVSPYRATLEYGMLASLAHSTARP